MMTKWRVLLVGILLVELNMVYCLDPAEAMWHSRLAEGRGLTDSHQHGQGAFASHTTQGAMNHERSFDAEGEECVYINIPYEKQTCVQPMSSLLHLFVDNRLFLLIAAHGKRAKPYFFHDLSPPSFSPPLLL